MSFRVLTISDRRPDLWYFCYNEFFKSLEQQGVTPFVIPNFNGLGTKPRELYKCITDGTVNEEIVIAVDCWDLVFQRPIYELVEKFKTQKSPIIISAEKTCFPADFIEKFDEIKYDNEDKISKYINSGFIIGYTSEVKKMLEAMNAINLPSDYHDADGWHHFNDQTMYHEIFFNPNVNMAMDINSEFCQSIYGLTIEDFSLEELDGRPVIKNRITGNTPYALHWNGGAKSMGTLHPMLKHLKLME